MKKKKAVKKKAGIRKATAKKASAVKTAAKRKAAKRTSMTGKGPAKTRPTNKLRTAPAKKNQPARKSPKARVAAFEKLKKAREDACLKDAIAVWAQLPKEDQVRLVTELIETRTAELHAVFSEDFDSVYFSYKRVGRKQESTNEPCICFSLKPERKKRKRLGKNQQLLPSHLFAYVGSKRKRQLCAVPTDVVKEKLVIAKSHRREPGSVRIDSNRNADEGVLTARVRVFKPDNSYQEYALSCLHVLGALSANGGAIDTTAVVTPREGSGNVITRRIFADGIIQPWEDAHDMALGEIADPQALLDSVTSPRPIRFADEIADIQLEKEYDIWVPNRSPIRVKFNEYLTVKTPKEKRTIEYAGFTSYLYNVVKSETLGTDTEAGFSGSPVFSQNGRVLLGMHIAGAPGWAFMVPAFELLEPLYYDLPQTDRLRFG